MFARFLNKKSISVEPLRAERLRAVRRRRRVVATILFFVLVCVVCIALAIASHSSRFSVRDIHIEGAEQTSPEVVRAFAEGIVSDGKFHFIARNNIFLYPLRDIERALQETYPRIKTVTASVDSFSNRTVRIAVSERTVFMQWCQTIEHAECFSVDADGFVFEKISYDDTVRTVYGVVYPHALHGAEAPLWGSVAPNHFMQLQGLMQQLDSFSFITQSVFIEEDDFRILLRNGFELYAQSAQNPAETVNALVSVLAQKDLAQIPQEHIAYIDVRFGERVFYKLKDSQ